MPLTDLSAAFQASFLPTPSCASEQALREALRKALHQLAVEEDVPAEDIGVLTPKPT